MKEEDEAADLHWRELAHSLHVVLRNQEQNSHNLFRAYVAGLAWRLYRIMCHQRRGEDFPHPPTDLEGIEKWLQTLG